MVFGYFLYFVGLLVYYADVIDISGSGGGISLDFPGNLRGSLDCLGNHGFSYICSNLIRSSPINYLPIASIGTRSTVIECNSQGIQFHLEPDAFK